MGLIKALEKIGLLETVGEGAAEDGPGQDAPGDGSPEPARERPVRAPGAPSVPDPSRDAALDSSAREQLLAAVRESGTGLHHEMEDLLSTLAETIPDEGARYKTAVRILVKKGSPVEALLSDVDACVGALQAKRREFESELADQVRQKVDARRQASKDLEARAADLRLQVERLQKDIESVESERASALRAAESESAALERVRQRFELVYADVQRSLELRKQKIVEYGRGS